MAAQLVFDRRPRAVLAVNDSLIMIRRSCTHIIRNTDQLLGAFFQPIMFLVLFAAVFGGAISKALPPGTNYLDFLMPGIIVQTLAFGSTTTAVAICNDLQKGIVDRFRSLPMSSLAVLNGHVAADLLRNTISTVVMLVVGLVIGFRSNASFTDWLAIAGIVLLFTLAFSWLSAIVGLVAQECRGRAVAHVRAGLPAHLRQHDLRAGRGHAPDPEGSSPRISRSPRSWRRFGH